MQVPPAAFDLILSYGTIMNKIAEENAELSEALNDTSDVNKWTLTSGGDCAEAVPALPMPSGNQSSDADYVQWTMRGQNMFLPASRTVDRIVPGVYEIHSDPNIGIYFSKIPVSTHGLLRFPQANSERIITEIQRFWTKKEIFQKYDRAYKRSILMWGPAGTGKSSVIKILSADVLDRNGVVIKFDSPNLFMQGMRIFRQIQPETPVVVLMEDIDEILHSKNESDILNLLDGVERVENIVFIATTNHPSRLGERIINRPGRFDKRYKIGLPDDISRRMYLQWLIKDENIAELKQTIDLDLDRWVRDSYNFSLAHLEELFKRIVLMGDDYEDEICDLRSMIKDKPTEDDDIPRGSIGFGQMDSYKSVAASSPKRKTPASTW